MPEMFYTCKSKEEKKKKCSIVMTFETFIHTILLSNIYSRFSLKFKYMIKRKKINYTR